MTRPMEQPSLDGPTWTVQTDDRCVVHTHGMTCTRTDSPSECLLRIEGVLDNHTTTDLKPVLDALAAANETRSVTVDLAGLSMIDSAGIGAIVALFKRLHASGRRVHVIRMQGQPRAIAIRLKLERIFGPLA